MHFTINPGSGDRDGATYENALEILRRFMDDLSKLYGYKDIRATTQSNRNSEGRFSWDVTYDGKTIELDIPGDDPAEVVAAGLGARRLYVDGSSWFYPFALNICSPDEN